MRWSSVVGGLAAAAALAFWFVPANITSPTAGPTNADSATKDSMIVFTPEPTEGESDVGALNLDEVIGADDWSARVAAFENELNEVADLLVSDDSGWDDYRLNDLDAIDDEIDDLFQELEEALET